VRLTSSFTGLSIDRRLSSDKRRKKKTVSVRRSAFWIPQCPHAFSTVYLCQARQHDDMVYIWTALSVIEVCIDATR